MSERMYGVAVRDGNDLFLWLRIRRSEDGDIYYVIPTGRPDSEWKRWNPHGSLHKDGRFHHKSFGEKVLPRQLQEPNSDFAGREVLVARPIASGEPRGFNEPCDPSKFSYVMEIPVGLLSSAKYDTLTSVVVTEANLAPVVDGVLAQHVFRDAISVDMGHALSVAAADGTCDQRGKFELLREKGRLAAGGAVSEGSFRV